MKQVSYIIKNEEGSVIVVALLILVALTVIGIAALNTSSIDIRIAGNEKFHKIAFYAAKAAGEYVVGNPVFYGNANSTVGGSINFDNDNIDNDGDGAVDEGNEQYPLGSGQSFTTQVTYLGQGSASGGPIRGTGNATGQYTAHRYRIDCTGLGLNNATSQVQIGFYRTGF